MQQDTSESEEEASILIQTSSRNIRDPSIVMSFNNDRYERILEPIGAIAAVVGMFWQERTDQRIEEAETRAAEARHAQEQERLAREEAETKAAEARHVQEQERLAREEAETKAAEARHAQEQERLAREEAERQERLERSLRELGIPPERKISETDICNARLHAGYREGCVNIVIVGNRGMGKSTLINTLRGLGPRDSGRAEVGEVEMTSKLAQYIDPRHENIVWYDVPGAGTNQTTAWQYYYDQKLFIFDKIVLLHDTTLTESDLRVLKLCKYRNQECIVVRSKADHHIRNRARRLGLDAQSARQGYIKEVEEEVNKHNMLTENGSPKELMVSVTDYIISEMGILQLVTGSIPSEDQFEQVIDEQLLLQDLGIVSDCHIANSHHSNSQGSVDLRSVGSSITG